jgi:hypothetical protein
MGKSHKPKRSYDSPEAGMAAVKRIFDVIWTDYVATPTPPSTLYHYCDDQGFKGILKSRHLWASDILRMNDPKEVSYAFADVIGPLVAEREQGQPKYFLEAMAPPDQIRNIWARGACTHIACFSSTPALPSQWRSYAKCAGYAIGFSRVALEEWCAACGAAGSGVSLAPVIYDTSIQTTLIRRFLDRVRQLETCRYSSLSATIPVRNAAREYLAILAMTLKDADYQAEEEWRMLIMQRGNGKFTRLAREKAGEGEVCYFELPLILPGLVTEIVRGPQCAADAAELRLQLTDAGLGAIKIQSAKCGCEEA